MAGLSAGSMVPWQLHPKHTARQGWRSFPAVLCGAHVPYCCCINWMSGPVQPLDACTKQAHHEASRVHVAPQALQHARPGVLGALQHARQGLCQPVMRGRCPGPQAHHHLHILAACASVSHIACQSLPTAAVPAATGNASLCCRGNVLGHRRTTTCTSRLPVHLDLTAQLMLVQGTVKAAVMI